MSMDDDVTRLPPEVEAGASLVAGQDFDAYRVVRLLGRGGMGEVYEVEHRVLRSRHALKLINREIAGRPDARARFEKEAETMCRLRHRHIVHVDDFRQSQGRAWLRMELIGGWACGPSGEVESGKAERPGSSLGHYLQAKGGKLPEAEARDILRQVLEGLAYAHGQGVVHRDLKPANVLLEQGAGSGERGAGSGGQGAGGGDRLSVVGDRLSVVGDSPALRALIADFGLVKLAGEQWVHSQVQKSVRRSHSINTRKTLPPGGVRPSTASTVSGYGSSSKALLGTYAYMSPEQKRGEEVDHRSDLYAVGLMAYQMLTGEESAGMESPSELVPELDPSWDDWVKQALALRVERRFQSAAAMLAALPVLTVPEPPACEALNEAAATHPRKAGGPPFIGSSDRVLRVPLRDFVGEPLEMLRVEAGTFLMGSPLSENGRLPNEGPQTTVRIAEPFWLGRFPLTQGQWESVMEITMRLDTANLPVVALTQQQAVELCARLTEMAQGDGVLSRGLRFTLPTEAEWEYACRAGSTSRYYLGETLADLDRAAWFCGNAEGRLRAVGEKAPNAWGFHDMLGNVWEWCADFRREYSGEKMTARFQPATGDMCVARGGSWGDRPEGCRCAVRGITAAGKRNGFIGFRLALREAGMDF